MSVENPDTPAPEPQTRPPTARAVQLALVKRYAGPAGMPRFREFVVLLEVPDRTGAETRRADALVFGLYQGKGLPLEGFEIKVARADWLGELKKPEKSAAFRPYCTRWWIAATPGIVRREELPAGWGLLELRGDRLVMVARAATNPRPEQLPRPLVASLLRAAFRQSDLYEGAQRDHELERANGECKRLHGALRRHREDLREALDQVSSLKVELAALKRNAWAELVSADAARTSESHRLEHRDEGEQSQNTAGS